MNFLNINYQSPNKKDTFTQDKIFTKDFSIQDASTKDKNYLKNIINELHYTKRESFIEALNLVHSKLDQVMKQFNNQYELLDVKKFIFTNLLDMKNKFVQDLRYQRGYFFNYALYQTDQFSKSFAIYTLCIIIYSLCKDDIKQLLQNIELNEWVSIFEKVLLKYNHHELYGKLYNCLASEIQNIFLTIEKDTIVSNCRASYNTINNSSNTVDSFSIYGVAKSLDTLLEKHLKISSSNDRKSINYKDEFPSIGNKQYLYQLLFDVGLVLDKLKSYKLLISDFEISSIIWHEGGKYLIIQTKGLIHAGDLIQQPIDPRYSHQSFYKGKTYRLCDNTFVKYDNALFNIYTFLKLLLERFNYSDNIDILNDEDNNKDNNNTLNITLSYFIKEEYHVHVINFLNNPLQSPLEFTLKEILKISLEINLIC